MQTHSFILSSKHHQHEDQECITCIEHGYYIQADLPIPCQILQTLKWIKKYLSMDKIYPVHKAIQTSDSRTVIVCYSSVRTISKLLGSRQEFDHKGQWKAL